MGSRIRERESPLTVPGSVAVSALGGPPDITYGSTSRSQHEICADTTEPPPYTDPHSLTINKRTVEPLRINGVSYPSIFTNEYSDYNPEYATGYSNAADPTFIVDEAYWYTKAIANMNPNKPVVDVPLFLFEFKDFPRMLRNLGEVLAGRINAKSVTGGHLAFEFGWKPLFSDLKDLLNIQELITKRLDLLESYGGSGLRLHRKLYDEEWVSGSWTHDVDETATILWHQQEKAKIWYTARPRLLDKIPRDKSQAAAMRAALGLDVGYATLWQMMPWSWLIDYFTNIGDIIESGRGNLRWEYDLVYLMYTVERSDVPIGFIKNEDNLSYTGGVYTNVWKSRSYQYRPQPMLAYTPFLTARKWAILGSLLTSVALGAAGPTS